MMWPSVRPGIVALNDAIEGKRIPWMYLDVKNLVTTGTGNLIDTVAEALALTWHRPDGTVADRAEVLAEWLYVKGRRDMASYGGGAFARVTHLRLDDEGLDHLIDGKLAQMETYLKGRFPQWETFPADAQLGILSIAWSCGPAFAFPRFVHAALERDWDECVKQCGISEAGNLGVRPRNRANRILFGNAATVEHLGADPSELAYPEVLPQATELG